MELLDDEDATAAKEAQQEKVRAALEGLWAKYDADGNGELSGDELQLLMKGYFENAEKVCTDPNTASTWLGRRRHRLC
jgi:hypothetical protein